MKVNNELIDKLSHLARLEFHDDEKVKIAQDLEKIIGFCEKLNEIDTENHEPLIFMTPESNILRADRVEGVITKDEALKNAPSKDSDYFKAPKVIKK